MEELDNDLSDKRYIAWVALSLLITLALGAYLRWHMADFVALFTPWGNLHHVHIHLGYYGVIFPMMWLSWRAVGADMLNTTTLKLYALCVVTSSFGFLFQGYGLVAIVGSTGILIIWLMSAYRLQRWSGLKGSWLSGIPAAILLSACCIPPIAISGGAERLLWLRCFLTLLLIGGAIPTACLIDGLVRPKWGGVWIVLTTFAALSVGPLDNQIMQLAFVGLGGTIMLASPKGFSANAAMWQITGISLIVIGLSEMSHPIAIAGTHYLLLGPVLCAMLRGVLKEEPLWLEWGYLCALLIFTAAIAAPVLLPSLERPAFITALSGSVVVVAWLLRGWIAMISKRDQLGNTA